MTNNISNGLLSVQGLRLLILASTFWNAFDRTLQYIAEYTFPNASQSTLMYVWWVYLIIFSVFFYITEELIKHHCKNKKQPKSTTITLSDDDEEQEQEQHSNTTTLEPLNNKIEPKLFRTR
jgi:flagellar biosynthesis/type III secretory pathway M-ring protein FliF/YscJ